MAIAPISSVSFRNNYNQVSFGGRRRDAEYNPGMTPMKKLAVPLAATILAMTPSNVSAKYNMDAEPVTTEVMANDTVATGYYDYENYNGRGGTCRIFFLDTDGNTKNDAEALMLQINYEGHYNELARGKDGRTVKLPDGSNKKYPASLIKKSTMLVDTLTCKETISKDSSGKESVQKRYYAEGQTTTVEERRNRETGELIRRPKEYNRHTDMDISEKFYNDLVDTLKDKVGYKTVKETREKKESDEFDLLDAIKIASALGL